MKTTCVQSNRGVFFAYLILIGLTIFQPSDLLVRNAKEGMCVLKVDEFKKLCSLSGTAFFTGDF